MPKRNSVDKSIIEGKCVSYFRAAIKSTATLDPYERRLAGFLQWYGRDCDSFVADAKSRPMEVEQKLMDFIGEQKGQSGKERDTARQHFELSESSQVVP